MGSPAGREKITTAPIPAKESKHSGQARQNTDFISSVFEKKALQEQEKKTVILPYSQQPKGRTHLGPYRDI